MITGIERSIFKEYEENCTVFACNSKLVSEVEKMLTAGRRAFFHCFDLLRGKASFLHIVHELLGFRSYESLSKHELPFGFMEVLIAG